MDSFELNKILGAILGTLLFVMGVGFLAEGIYHPIERETAGYALPEPEPVAGSAEATTGSNQPSASIAMLLASANIEDGKASAKKCQSCHNFVKDGPNGQGPNLWGVVGRPIASHPGFNYSDAMLQHAKEAGTWTYDELNAFLPSPKARVPGTKMGFAGVKDDQERANIIAFLSTLSDNPVPFPAPAAAAEQPTPATEGSAPAKTDASQPAPTTTQSETPVAGTATGSNTPAGADTTGNAAPAATSATTTTTAAPAATPAATTTTAAPAATPAATTTTSAAPVATPATATTTAPAATEIPATTTTTTAAPVTETPATTTTIALKPAVPMTPPTTTTTAQ